MQMLECPSPTPLRSAQREQVLFERLELKYLIDESTARALAREISCYCEPDPHNAVLGGRGYPIDSLYLDTADYALHRAKIRGDGDRFKLRARTYDDEGPVHLEVKRKVGDVVLKTRVAVPRDSWADAARGAGRPIGSSPGALRRLATFCHLQAQLVAEPTLLVRYEREAWISDLAFYARITFDRAIAAAPVSEWNLSHSPLGTAWTYLDGNPEELISPTILELKCEQRMPLWMSELIHDYGLRCSGFSKYCSGVVATGLVPDDPWGAFHGRS